MYIKKMITTLSMLVLVIGTTACYGPEPKAPANKVEHKQSNIPTIYTVNYPLAAIASFISGDLAEVYFPATSGEDPAEWRPSAETIIRFQSADRVLLNGANYAKWLSQVSLSHERLVNTGLSFQDKWLPLTENVIHSHGLKGKHSHNGYAFSIWMNFELAAQQAGVIGETLMTLLPQVQPLITQRTKKTQARLRQWDARIQAATQKLWGDEQVLFSHPVYQYFEQRYHVNGLSLHWEPNKIPSDADWAQIKKLLEKSRQEGKPLDWMVWEAQPMAETATRLEQLGLKVFVFSPLAGNQKATEETSQVNPERYWNYMESSIAEMEALANE